MIVDIILISIAQLTFMAYARSKNWRIADPDGDVGIFMYIPILGPISIIMAFGLIAVFVAPFLIPSGISWCVDKIVRKRDD